MRKTKDCRQHALFKNSHLKKETARTKTFEETEEIKKVCQTS